MEGKSPTDFALVLPGAVSRGAYEAGVIEVLAEQNTPVTRIVATSSGALNGIAFALGIRTGRKKEMAAKLVETWINSGGWQSSLSLNPLKLLTGKGFSDSSGLLKMLRSLLEPAGSSVEKHPVDLRIIVTPLDGITGSIGRQSATTYEKVINFSGLDFDTSERLEKMFKVVTAACAFPGLFQAVELDGLGACIDGGAVNNAPIRYAVEDSNVHRVIMPVPFPAVMKLPKGKGGMNLLNHLIEILINERLYRDLKAAHSVNHEISKLKTLVKEGILTLEQQKKIESALSIHNVEITEIRPSENLKCSPFSGFFHKQDRERMIEEGNKAARRMLAKIPVSNPEGLQTT